MRGERQCAVSRRSLFSPGRHGRSPSKPFRVRRRGGRQEHTNERSMALVLAWCQNQKEARAVTIARPDKELTRTGAPPTPATRRACESFRELGIPRDVSPGEKGT
jgi:hypothetical protein